MSFTSVITSIVIGGAVFGTTPSPTPTPPPAPVAYTVVTGVVYGTNGNPVSSGSVNVTCGSGNQTVSIISNGSYQATFSQSQCKTGNTASANANTSQGSGANSAPVKNTAINGPAVDIDISVVNINLSVPEFGALTGILSMAGAAGTFLYNKRKMLG